MPIDTLYRPSCVATDGGHGAVLLGLTELTLITISIEKTGEVIAQDS
jgi:hypothetical protein